MAHRHRDNLTGEHHIGDIGQLTLYCLFMALWISDMVLNYSNFLNDYVPAFIRLPIGIMLLVISGYTAATGLWIVFGNKVQQGVIRKGVFRFVRHPIYLSEIILYLGLLMIHISLAAACVTVIAMFFLHYISRHEEKLLLARFPDEYRQYMKEVPMWFPRFNRR
ncbi:MAG: isoprenylcysteine carboxylmethyltransferase family protein [Dehalococcoidia bacterium]|nr:isoprenylcysteine carboxylmethyltransferase family protein [Dehalococcoidia bacterium]